MAINDSKQAHLHALIESHVLYAHISVLHCRPVSSICNHLSIESLHSECQISHLEYVPRVQLVFLARKKLIVSRRSIIDLYKVLMISYHLHFPVPKSNF